MQANLSESDDLRTAVEFILKTGEVSVWKYYINDGKFYTMLGHILSPDGTTYEQFSNSIAEESRSAYHTAFENLIGGKSEKELISFHYLDPQTGADLYLHNTMAIVVDAHGHPYSIIGTQKDITKDVLREQQLEEFKIKTNLINEKNHIIQWDYDIKQQQIVTYGNGALQEGATMNIETYLRYVHPSQREMLCEILRQMSRGELESFDTVLRIHLPGHSDYRHTIINALPRRDKNGTITSYTGIRRDATEEILKSKELAERTYKTELISKASGLMSWEYDCKREVFISDDNTLFGKDMDMDSYLSLAANDYRNELKTILDIMRECRDESFSIDLKYRLLDGWRYATVAGEPYERDADGKVTRYLGYRNDTTDMVLMNENIRESKLKTDMAIKNANMVMWEYSTDEKMFMAFNDPLTAYDTTVKYSPQEYVSALDSNSIQEAIEAIEFMDRQELGEFSFKSKVMLPDSPQWQYITIFGSHTEVSEDDPTKATKYVGFRVNNTEQVKLLQGLEESNILTTSILAQSPSMIFIKDITDQWRYVLANDLFCQLFDYTEEQVIGRTDHEMFDKTVADKFRADDIKAVNYDGVYSFIEQVTTNEQTKALHTTKKVITMGNGHQLLIGITSDISGTLAQQRALDQANTKAELVLNNAKTGLVYVDNDFRIVWENADSIDDNPHIKRYKRGGICYKSLYGFDKPCTNCVILKAQKSLTTEKTTQVFDDGIIIDIYATPVIGSDKQINGYVCRIDNVTENVMKARKLEDTQKYLDLAINAGDVAVWGYDPKRDVVFNISGKVFKQDVLPLQEATAYLHPDDRAAFAESWARLYNGESENESICLRFMSPFTGKLEYVDKSMTTLRLPSGELDMIIGTHHDVTADKMQKIALEQSKERAEEASVLLQSIIKQIPFGLYIKDINNDFRYVIMNDVLAKIDAIDSKYAIGKTDYDLFDKDIADTFYRENVLTANQPDGKLTVLKTTIDWHGEKNIYENTDTAITVAGRRLLVGVVADITEKEHMLSELQIAKERAEQSDKLKSAFLANMSHEIRTPLNAIVGFSEMLIEAEDAAEREEYTNIISVNNELLLRLIGDILDLSKIESGMIELKSEPFDLSQVCDEVYLMLKQKATNPKIDFVVENPYRHCTVELDKNRMKQVGINFITNAIKYTAEGMIKMGYQYVNNGIMIYVEDTGIGIAEENHSKVFERFEKFDTFAQGTGLGLSICKAIIEAQGGKIGFDSEVGKGSRFWAWFPCSADITDGDAPDNNDCDPIADNSTVAQQSASGDLRILVAEDNDSNYMLFKHLLKEYHLTRATNGAEAVQKARDERFNIILMDWKMPIMNGIDATIEIRKFNTKIPIIAVTANAFDANRIDILKAGCNAFVAKPLKRKELFEAIDMFK